MIIYTTLKKGEEIPMMAIAKEFLFSDCVEIVTNTYDNIIYSPVYSEEIGLYLYCEDHKPIKNIFLNGSKLFIHYIDGTEEMPQFDVRTVLINGNNFKRKMKSDIEDMLFRYGVSEANRYNLDITKAYDYRAHMPNVKKRSL